LHYTVQLLPEHIHIVKTSYSSDNVVSDWREEQSLDIGNWVWFVDDLRGGLGMAPKNGQLVVTVINDLGRQNIEHTSVFASR